MPKIAVLSSGTGYKREDGTFYMKDLGGKTHVKFTIDNRTGVWVIQRQREKFDPEEEVTPINRERDSCRPPRNQATPPQRRTLTADALLTQIGQEWLDHDSLLRSVRQKWIVQDLDFTMFLTQLRNSDRVIRERRQAGRKMSYHYKKHP